MANKLLQKSKITPYLVWLILALVLVAVALLVDDATARQLILIFLVVASTVAMFGPVSEALRERQPQYSLAVLSLLIILIFERAWLLAALTALVGVAILLAINLFKRTFHERVAFWLDNRLPLARVLRLHGEEIVPFAKVFPGDRVVVEEGERVPVDGFLLEEKTVIQNAFVASDKQELVPGDPVSAGSVALNKTVVEATHTGADTTWLVVAQVVQGFFSGMPKIYRDWAHRFFWTQVVWILFVFGWQVLVGGTSAAWLALAGLWWLGPLVTYLLSFNIITRSFKKGIVFKDWSVIERQKKIQVAVFDKTGTLTLDWMRVVDIKTVDEFFVEDVVRLAAALEQGIDHPISRTLARKAREMDLSLPQTSDPSLLLGFGVAADVDGETFTLCSAALVESLGLEVPADFKVLALKYRSQGATSIYLLSAKKVIAIFVLTDILRPRAKDFVNGLKSLGINKMHVVSGDNREPVLHVADLLGLPAKNVWANLSPDRKIAHVKKMADRYTMLVGDPDSDKGALAASHFGVAFLGRGPALREPGSRMLVRSSDLTKIVEGLKVAGRLKMIWRLAPVLGAALSVGAALLVFLLGGLAI